MACFQILHTDRSCDARRGVLTTPHGNVQTPAFMPVGTAGAVKGIMPADLENIGAEMILANTYHLLLRPGVDCIEKLGGLHKFMAWDKPILTDSGGYQLFSLGARSDNSSGNHIDTAGLCSIDDEGVRFKSHIDGQEGYLDAEIATAMQNKLGAEVIMAFDQCPPFPCPRGDLEKAVERTINWARRSRRAHKNPQQLQFGIIQGGIDVELRRQCSAELVELDFDGYAMGGLSVGEGHHNMVRTLVRTCRFLPEAGPRYLMGVGMPEDIIAAVKQGVDMFDCVLPTRNGRNAYAFTRDGPVRMRNSIHADSSEPVEADCDCYCCRNFTRAAVRHFFNVGEMIGPILLSLHNLRFYQRLMAEIRKAIDDDVFPDWADTRLKEYNWGCEPEKSSN